MSEPNTRKTTRLVEIAFPTNGWTREAFPDDMTSTTTAALRSLSRNRVAGDEALGRISELHKRIQTAQLEKKASEVAIPRDKAKKSTRASDPASITTTSELGALPSPTPAPSKPKRTIVRADQPQESNSSQLLEDTGSKLLSELQKESSNISLLQAPSIAVCPVYETASDVASGFTFSSLGRAKASLFVDKPHLLVASFCSLLVHWKDRQFRLGAQDAVAFLSAVLTSKTPIDVITFDLEYLLLPLLMSNSVCPFYCTGLHDIRVLGWMLASHDCCSDLDALLLRYLDGSAVSHSPITTMDGCMGRLVHLTKLYQTMYRALGRLGMLPSYMQVERHIPILCARMKVAGFAVHPESIADFSKATRTELEILRQRAVDLAGTAFNLQSSDDCRRILFDQLHLEKYLASNQIAGIRTAMYSSYLFHITSFPLS